MINGERVKQARQLRGLTQDKLGERIGVNQSSIAQIESGRIIPTDKVLQGIVLQTGFPLAFFKQPTSSEFPLGSLSYRSRASTTVRERSKAHQYAVIVYEVIKKMEPLLKSDINLTLPMLTNDDPITSAQITRSSLGLSPDKPIQNLVNTIERCGVLVLALPSNLDLEDVEAFSSWLSGDTPIPVIVVLGKKPGDRLRFSVAHELGHLVLHNRVKGVLTQIEEEANKFGAELLMPEEAMRQEIAPPVDLFSLAKLKPRWKVSIQALIRRAHDLEIITPRRYKYLMQQLSSHGWRKKEPDNLNIPIEKPRTLSKMAELLYGNPVNYKKLASDMCLPSQLVRDAIEANSGKITNDESDAIKSGHIVKQLYHTSEK